MKRATKVILVTVLGLGVVSAGIAGYGHHRFGDPEKRAAWMVEKVEKQLELDGNQVVKLQALSDQILALRTDMHQEKQQKKQQVLDLLSAQTLDQQAVIDMVTEKTRLVDSEAPNVIATLAEFTDSLDTEQKQELVDLLEWRLGHDHH